MSKLFLSSLNYPQQFSIEIKSPTIANILHNSSMDDEKGLGIKSKAGKMIVGDSIAHRHQRVAKAKLGYSL